MKVLATDLNNWQHVLKSLGQLSEQGVVQKGYGRITNVMRLMRSYQRDATLDEAADANVVRL